MAKTRTTSVPAGQQLKVGLIGDGKMGQLVRKVCAKRGHTIVGAITSTQSDYARIFRDADVLIDFSHGSAIGETLRIAATLEKPLVTGTTGYDMGRLGLTSAIPLPFVQNPPFHLSIVDWETLIKNGVVYAPNFSEEVLNFFTSVERVIGILPPNTYSVRIVETHHTEKKDAPSGTAKHLRELIKKIQYKGNEDILIKSIRKGKVVGRHEVIFETSNGEIRLVSNIKKRESFAAGAVNAAERLVRKSRAGSVGILSLDQLLNEPMLHNQA